MPVWQPEPLHIPADDPPRRQIRQPDEAGETDGEDDRPGSHVIVIDLA